MSARRSAGASLTPSPVIATTCPSALQRVGDAQLRLGRAAREDQLVALVEQEVELALAHLLELLARDDRRAVRRDPDAARDLGRGRAVVAGDDDDADAGGVAALDGVRHLGRAAGRRARRGRGSTSSRSASSRRSGGAAPGSGLPGDGEHAQALAAA